MKRKDWIIVLFIFILTLIITNISPLVRIFQLKKELEQGKAVPIKKYIELKPVEYIAQEQSAISLGTEHVPLDRLVKQAEDKIDDLAQQASWDLKSMYNNINEKRYSSLSLKVGK